MFDRVFSAALAFGVLLAATLAIGTAMLEQPRRVVQLPRVEVTGKRPAPVQTVAQCDTGAATQVR